ncbi:MAG: aminotransferase class V-fold PLP-dependent enzyme [Ruminococcaceae bacterium]|nr:aminotransferase class V-fold PLP-dependent enzyme [Oscillospiraceae bacterium]
MTTPIFDFVKKYSESDTVRFHMPGHKGIGELGCEKYDLTEIFGADVLYSADGIINESENNLSSLYGTAHSFYSTEGSTLAIFAMLALVTRHRAGEKKPLILAGRNVHTAFVKAAALLDLEVEWLYPERSEHLCSCEITAPDLKKALSGMEKMPRAVYVTSPDYLGNMLDIASLAEVCRKYGVPLLVDNAHGAYLKFLKNDIHPITLGAAMCADSAHKTLPVLTGGAYLHISKDFPELVGGARRALSLFASTSPSYLTLASLDLCNKRLAEDYPEKIVSLAEKIAEVKAKISSLGFEVAESEPLKIVVRAGEPLADHLRGQGIECEFSDSEYTVLMLTPENSDSDLERLLSAIETVERKAKPLSFKAPKPHERVMSIREAVLSECESIKIESSLGRICASPTVSCPPAVPIVISGERITREDIELFKHYGIEFVDVVIE